MTTVILHTLLRSIEYIVKKSLHSFTSLVVGMPTKLLIIVFQTGTVFLNSSNFYEGFLLEAYCWAREPYRDCWVAKRPMPQSLADEETPGKSNNRLLPPTLFCQGLLSRVWCTRMTWKQQKKSLSSDPDSFYNFVFKVVKFIYLLHILI